MHVQIALRPKLVWIRGDQIVHRLVGSLRPNAVERLVASGRQLLFQVHDESLVVVLKAEDLARAETPFEAKRLENSLPNRRADREPSAANEPR
jgi:hypothetical protein